ncbi:NUDIX hydrolase N-terminal domain-containing protein [Sporolactobacillus sp. KGMB 08714]
MPALAEAGLYDGRDPFDKERYEELKANSIKLTGK